MRMGFDAVTDPTVACDDRPFDHLMPGFAVFPGRMPSPRRLDRQFHGGENPVPARNLRPLFGEGRASDCAGDWTKSPSRTFMLVAGFSMFCERRRSVAPEERHHLLGLGFVAGGIKVHSAPSSSVRLIG